MSTSVSKETNAGDQFDHGGNPFDQGDHDEDFEGDEVTDDPAKGAVGGQAQGLDSKVSQRRRVMTNKYQLYQMSISVKEFTQKVRRLKRFSREVSIVLSNVDDLSRIKELQQDFIKEFEGFVTFYENLEDLADGDLDDDLVSVYLEQERAGESVLRSLNDRVRKLIDGKDSVDSKFELQNGIVDEMASSAKNTQDLISTLCTQLSLARLPAPEPVVFCGEVLMYRSWKKSFETLVSSRGIPEEERLHYLGRYIGGEARECIECYLLMDSLVAFENAFKNLDRRFGNSFIIGERMRDKIDSFPKISGKDSLGLRRFADYLRQCESCMDEIPGLKFLNDPRENRKLLQKCPDWLVQRWRRQVVQYQSQHNDFPSFSAFVKFLLMEAEIANEPFTLFSVEGKSKEPLSNKTSCSQVVKNAKSHAVESKRVSCLYCSKSGHPVEKCFKFDKLSVTEKDAFVLKKKLCRGCLSTGHIYKKCNNKSKCSTCQRNHPTCLHDCVEAYREQQKSSIEGSNLQPDAQSFVPGQGVGTSMETSGVSVQSHSYAAASVGGCLSSMIVPVYVSHRGDPHTERLVYALLDNQSDTTFVLDHTLEALNVRGPQVDLSLSTMFAEDCRITCQRANGLVVRGFDSQNRIELPTSYSRPIIPANRAHIPTVDMARKWPHLQFLKSKLMPVCESAEIGLLIGYNCNRALIPREIRAAQSGPFAQRTDLGWGIVGIVDSSSSNGTSNEFSHRIVTYEVREKFNQIAFRTCTKELVSPREVLGVLERDFKDVGQGTGLSLDDKRFLDIMKSKVCVDKEGHYVLPLPFRTSVVELSSNRSVAEKRLKHLKSKLDRDPEYKQKYTSFMQEMIVNKYAKEVSECDLQKVQWFLPHHGVVNKSKKLRVVFDCSAKFKGKSINDCLLQGPDLNNSLIGVLLRFRKDFVAFSCDITKMYYQFRVPEPDRFYMCYLWWEDGFTQREPCVYAMQVHTFGLKSSPSCCVFGLQQAADDHEEEYGEDVANFLRSNFYVDDGLKSVSDPGSAISLIKRTIELCERAKLRLHKFVSNSEEVLASISNDRRMNSGEVDLRFEELPIERALGVEWRVQSDTFQFRVDLKQSTATRRGLLATVASLYDPLGFISPFTLVGKRILQSLCIAGIDWDEEISDDLKCEWFRWLQSFEDLEKIEIPRCVKPKGFVIGEIQLHHFCDASTIGYGCCSYLRLVGCDGVPYVSFIMGKSRVAPIKPVTVPRLELSAAVLAVKVARILDTQLGYDNANHFYWSDSKVVLGYIANTAKRFHVFVSNRVGFIHSHSNVNQWHYVPGDLNVADIASRGCLGMELVVSKWFKGPDFLWDLSLPCFESRHKVCDDDPEVKKVKTLATVVSKSFLMDRFEHISRWNRLKRVVGLILLLKGFLRSKQFGKRSTRTRLSVCESVTVEVLAEAEREILKVAQRSAFSGELEALTRSQPIKLSSSISRLDCFLEDGLLKVGGRLRHSGLPHTTVHPVVVPKNSHVGNLIIAHCHNKVLHQGKGMTLNEIRSNGYWIVGCRLSVASHIYRCVVCRRLRANPCEQKMADLPADRVQSSPPFTFCGVDLFGPFLIREGRKELKRWGCIFTCLSSRAVHLEVVNSLSSSSFINALRRFIAIRGPISLLRCDQGTNFVGANSELRAGFENVTDTSVKQFLLNNNCVFEFKPNPPSASHMSGAWERLIRSVRSILNTLMLQHSSQLDDESLRTFLCEVAAVINSRPLTLEYLSDPNFEEPLTPNSILTMKSKIVVAPPGEFQKDDIYSVKRWRRVQYLLNQFWSRWQTEYVHCLQYRNKWSRLRRNLAIGDIVVLKDEALPRNLWHLGRISDVNKSVDGHVRSVKVVVGTSNLSKTGQRSNKLACLERPVNKLVLLVENNV